MNQKNTESKTIKFTCTPEEDGRLLVDLIAEKSDLSKSLIKKLMMAGAVFQTTNNKRQRFRKAKRFTKTNDIVECYYDPKIDLDEFYEFTTLYESTYYGIYHKPAGAMTEGTNYGDSISVYRHVEKNKRHAYLVNRLDKQTEGLVIIAYDSKTQNLLQTMWRNEVIKKYQAIVLGKLEGEGEFNRPINGKVSQTNYRCVSTDGNQTQVDITLITERKHQSRIHFADAGFPIMGDPRYGKKNKNKDGLQLVSYSLEFKDPYTNNQIKALLPKDRLLF